MKGPALRDLEYRLDFFEALMIRLKRIEGVVSFDTHTGGSSPFFTQIGSSGTWPAIFRSPVSFGFLVVPSFKTSRVAKSAQACVVQTRDGEAFKWRVF
jgi:hypothetical protein